MNDTPTPLTDAAEFDRDEDCSIEDNLIVTADFARILETELSTALARVAELDGYLVDYAKESNELQSQIDSLTRQLSESQTQLASLREANAVLQSQVDNADINLEQVRVTQKGLWRTKVESAESRIKELEAQLTSAREDSAKAMDALRDIVAISAKEPENLHESQVQRYSSFAISIAATALGHLAETPAGGETGKDAWQPIEKAPKDGTGFLMCFPLQGNLRTVGWFSKIYKDFLTTGGRNAGIGWLWQPLPPPPQGKETRE